MSTEQDAVAVERVKRAIEAEHERYWLELDGTIDNIPQGQYIEHARQHERNVAAAALTAMIGKEPSE